MKCAVFVEGQSEMYFVAHFLQTYYNYDGNLLYLESHELRSKQLNVLGYPKFGVKNIATNYYMIVNVGNDNSVSSVLNSRYKGLLSQGFEFLIGLRDVYGDQYKTLNQNQRFVNRTLINKMWEKQTSELKTTDITSSLHFAVMEVEAWMLGIMDVYLAKRDVDINDITSALKLDFMDYPEQIYHPTSKVKEIFKYLGEDYDKHSHDTLSFLDRIERSNYQNLFQSGKCPSFNSFVSNLLTAIEW